MDISDKESSKDKHTRHALTHAPALFVPCLPFCCCGIIAQLACASATLLPHAALCNLLAAACIQAVFRSQIWDPELVQCALNAHCTNSFVFDKNYPNFD
jgi:hypothetical protein